MSNKAFVYDYYNKLFVDTDMFNKNFKSFGEWLRHCINHSGLSNAEVGRRVGVSGTYIGNLIRDYSPNSKSGKIRASEEIVEKLARLFNYDLNEVRDYAGYSIKGIDQINVVTEFPILTNEYQKLTEKGKKVIQKQVDFFVRSLLDYEGINFEEEIIEGIPVNENPESIVIRPDQILDPERLMLSENAISIEEVRKLNKQNITNKKTPK